MKIQENFVVGMHYTLKDSTGEVIDSSEGGDLLSYLQGAGNIIVGLEKALEGKEKGDKIEVAIEPEEGYGPHREELIQEAPVSAFQGIDNLEVGMSFQAETEQGPVPVRITAINGDTVTVDGNHELAGEKLFFSVCIEEVREATEDELAHGHIHGEGCNHDH
jgi:FKBP-type peptidyl-prolyl cis-trans isomerase SlyD